MPTELDDIIDLNWYVYNAAYGVGTTFGNVLSIVGEHLYNHDYEAAGTALLTLTNTFHSFREKALSRYSSQSYRVLDALQWISDNWPEAADPYELTMADIIYAMLTADAGQIEHFIGISDAYKQFMWNKPFNKEFFAAIARGFE